MNDERAHYGYTLLAFAGQLAWSTCATIGRIAQQATRTRTVSKNFQDFGLNQRFPQRFASRDLLEMFLIGRFFIGRH